MASFFNAGRNTPGFQGRGRPLFAGVLLVSALAISPVPAGAWFSEPHKAITRNALSVLPEALRETLAPHNDILVYGSVQPDLQRLHDHKAYLSGLNGSPPGPGSAHYAMERFAKKAEGMIKKRIEMDKIAYVLGQAAHFIQDVNEPLHTVSGETKEQHYAYERVAYYWEWPGSSYGYRGFYLVKNYKCFAVEAAKRSHIGVRQALQDPPDREVIERTWDDAVNDTANLWQSIFYRALGPTKAKEMYGIQPPAGEKGKLCR